jgi:hypothetical protein
MSDRRHQQQHAQTNLGALSHREAMAIHAYVQRNAQTRTIDRDRSHVALRSRTSAMGRARCSNAHRTERALPQRRVLVTVVSVRTAHCSAHGVLTMHDTSAALGPTEHTSIHIVARRVADVTRSAQNSWEVSRMTAISTCITTAPLNTSFVVHLKHSWPQDVRQRGQIADAVRDGASHASKRRDQEHPATTTMHTDDSMNERENRPRQYESLTRCGCQIHYFRCMPRQTSRCRTDRSRWRGLPNQKSPSFSMCCHWWRCTAPRVQPAGQERWGPRHLLRQPTRAQGASQDPREHGLPNA